MQVIRGYVRVGKGVDNGGDGQVWHPRTVCMLA